MYTSIPPRSAQAAKTLRAGAKMLLQAPPEAENIRVSDSSLFKMECHKVAARMNADRPERKTSSLNLALVIMVHYAPFGTGSELSLEMLEKRWNHVKDY